MTRTTKSKRDIFYRLAKEQGWRARSVYKLLQLDQQYSLLGKDVRKVVDLCAAPGSWSQVLSRKLYTGHVLGFGEYDVVGGSGSGGNHCNGGRCDDCSGSSCGGAINDTKDVNETNKQDDRKIIAVDLQKMAPLHGVVQLQGDITLLETSERIKKELENAKADLIVCDGAPDVTGLHDMDEYVQGQLIISALNICLHCLKDGGNFVAKIFVGPDEDILKEQLAIFFESVSISKPSSSRDNSSEAFIVCERMAIPSRFDPLLFTTFIESGYDLDFLKKSDRCDEYNLSLIPDVACGDKSGYPPRNTTDADVVPLSLDVLSLKN